MNDLVGQGGGSRWDECWECPRCHNGWAMGNGKRGGGNAIVTFISPPRCGCGAEMEQVTSIGIDPPKEV